MGNEFSGLPMGDLIGAPLNAACDAQIRLAKATADFINTVGFNPEDPTKPDSKLVPRQVDFAFWRPSNELVDDGAGGKIAKVEKVAISVPFLAIVNVPALSIKSVDIIFDMEVKTSESSRESQDVNVGVDATMKVGWGPFSAQVNVKASVASHKENTRSTDKSAKYHVEVHARDDGMPEGLARVLDMLQSAIAPVSVSKQVNANDAQAKLGSTQQPVT
ncbi:MAG: DUF2589 domain-containing protein [Nannocystaceae bacterium]